jgi:hypothetical protein
LFALNEFVG